VEGGRPVFVGERLRDLLHLTDPAPRLAGDVRVVDVDVELAEQRIVDAAATRVLANGDLESRGAFRIQMRCGWAADDAAVDESRRRVRPRSPGRDRVRVDVDAGERRHRARDVGGSVRRHDREEDVAARCHLIDGTHVFEGHRTRTCRIAATLGGPDHRVPGRDERVADRRPISPGWSRPTFTMPARS
jgi:hypothetical protein